MNIKKLKEIEIRRPELFYVTEFQPLACVSDVFTRGLSGTESLILAEAIVDGWIRTNGENQQRAFDIVRDNARMNDTETSDCENAEGSKAVADRVVALVTNIIDDINKNPSDNAAYIEMQELHNRVLDIYNKYKDGYTI
jgi:hypothetical protein